MNSNVFCPISINKIDDHVARLNGAFTVAVLLLALFLQSWIPVAFLLVDFFLRSAELGKYSLLAIVSKGILKSLSVKPYLINAGPKIFAARIGVLFSFLVVVLSVLDLNIAAIVVGAIFGICAFLEAAFGFCVACRIYPLFYKLFQSRELNKIKKFGFQDFEI